MSIRVLLVDDERLMREALAVFVRRSPRCEVVGEAADGLEAITAVERCQPDVVLMDLSMPRMNGIEATRRIVAEHPGVRVIALTTFATAEAIAPMLRAGADGYLVKDCPADAVVEAVERVHAGRSVLAPALANALVDLVRDEVRDPARPVRPDAPAPALTVRERETLELLAEGLGNADIARELHLSEAAVKSRMSQIAQKLGVSSRVQILVRAVELGLARARLRA